MDEQQGTLGLNLALNTAAQNSVSNVLYEALILCLQDVRTHVALLGD